MTNFCVIAGHNEIVPGASGNGYKEHIVARQVKDRVIYFLQQLNETTFDCTDEVGTTKTQVWMNAANNCNKAIGKNGYIIAIHLNASADGRGTGVEVFDYKGTQKATCQAIAQRLAKDFSWPVRRNNGWDDGSWIGLIKQTQAPVIYVELCFIDNISDITKLVRNIDMAAIGIVESITGKKINILTTSTVTEPVTIEHSKEVEDMTQLFEPSNQAIRNAVSRVLLRFQDKEPGLSTEWRDKANSGQLTLSDAIGLLYIAVDRGYIQK